MASRSGAGPNGHRTNRPRDAQQDFPPLPNVPRLPSLRNLNAERNRLGPPSSSDSGPITAGSGINARPQTRFWSAAARRAERIRNLDDSAPSLDDLEQSSMDQSWFSSSRRPSRLRPVGDAAQHRRPNLDELDQTLDQANSHLRTLLDMTNHINLITPLLRSTFSPTIRSHDFPDDNTRSKRRKLDSNRQVPSPKSFRYGRYGQVEPGQLQMEIVSCDGGMFSNETSYAAENILKDDNSVYCTKGNRCNIILRHQGGTVFTLEQLIVKAPASMNYSHPIREGMVFIAMDADDVLSRTAQYQVQYVHQVDLPFLSPVEVGVNHPRVSLDQDPRPRHIISIRHHDDGTTSTRVRRSHHYPHNPSSYQSNHQDSPTIGDRRMPEMPREFIANQPDFRVTTECSDEEDTCDMPHILRRVPPNRIGSLPFETESSDSDDDDNNNNNHTLNPFGYSTDDITESFHRQIHGPSTTFTTSTTSNSTRPHISDRHSVSLSEAWDAHASATQEAVRAVGGELLVPHARFFIEKKKSKCTIRFDPPVSGRFILLKMWSSHHDPSSNIDIQSVMARGYAGPRYFPSMQLS